ANAPPARGATWIAAGPVAEVEFKNRTTDGLLRQPVFLRLRDDKSPEECVADDEPLDPPEPPPTAAPARTVALTNVDKVFWPDEGWTKGDLIAYYDRVAPWLLPYLRDRPLVLTRYPDGITGKSFFQKDAPAYAPDWIRRETIWSEQAEREVRYFIV